MSNEIKQGDRVRVSGHYIAMMITDGIVHDALNNATFVVDNIDREGRMAYVSCKLPVSIQSPIAQLVKVDAEAKEPKIKVGDKVHVKGSVLLEGGVFSIIGADYHEKLGWRYELNNHEWYPGIDLEPYTEPTDQTEVEKKPNVGSITIPVEVDLTDSYWDAYAADLAKEVALKLVNNENPDKIGEVAAKVAKSVVENLKK